MAEFMRTDVGASWIIIEWRSKRLFEGFSLVNCENVVIGQSNKFSVGKIVKLETEKWLKTGRIVMVSEDKQHLEKEVKRMNLEHFQNFTNRPTTSGECNKDADDMEDIILDAGEQEDIGSDSDWTPNCEERKAGKSLERRKPKSNTKVKTKTVSQQVLQKSAALYSRKRQRVQSERIKHEQSSLLGHATAKENIPPSNYKFGEILVPNAKAHHLMQYLIQMRKNIKFYYGVCRNFQLKIKALEAYYDEMIMQQSKADSIQKELKGSDPRNMKVVPSFRVVSPKMSERKMHHESVNQPTSSGTGGSEMVPIGSGATQISRHVYTQVKLSNYALATRKLLMALFPRRTLATHSLTGKQSPAFTNKPAKAKLDERIIRDIIMTISQIFKDVPERLIRNVITTKCADECKMFRVRQEKLQKRKDNKENHKPE